MFNAGYHQIVKVPTFVTSGSLPGHAYARLYSRLPFQDPQCQVKSVYYSDQCATLLQHVGSKVYILWILQL